MRLQRLSDEEIVQRILTRTRELTDAGLLPTIRNLGAIGCHRTRVLKIRNHLIVMGLVQLPPTRVGVLIKPQKVIERDYETRENPGPEEQRAIRDRIDKIHDFKITHPDKSKPTEFKIYKLILSNHPIRDEP